MEQFVCILFVLLVRATVEVQSHGSFITYSGPDRQDFEARKSEHLNEIDSVDEHWKGDHDEDIITHNDNGKKVLSDKYEPNWSSIDSRPLPQWFDQSKVGIFVHWGVFSVTGFFSEWFWYYWQTAKEKSVVDFVNNNYKPNWTYQEFAPQFTAEFYNPVDWAKLFEKSGAKYVVLTTKHVEGFTLWPSKNSFSWNAMDVEPHRDLVGDLANAIRSQTKLRFGVYHSLYEWFNPLYMQDKANNYTTNDFVRFKTMPELYDLVNTYHPDLVWSDGEYEAEDTYWGALQFLAWLYNESPVRDEVVTNDRWGTHTMCKHGGYFTCGDKFNPGILPPFKWENCMMLDKQSWGNRRNANIEDYLSPEELITTLVETIACGGNILVNVGPTKEGMIPVIQQERLVQMGEWLGINGEAIYNSVPYRVQNDTVTPGVWYTTNADKSKVFAMVTKWPQNGKIALGAVKLGAGSKVGMLGAEESLNWQSVGERIVVKFPRMDLARSKWVWTLVFQNVTY